MALSLIRAVPGSVACIILQDWLELKSLVAVDSAFCNKRERQHFLSLLKSDTFTLQKQSISIDVHNCSKVSIRLKNHMMGWIVSREVPSQQFVILPNSSVHHVSTYFEKCGTKIKSLAVNDGKLFNPFAIHSSKSNNNKDENILSSMHNLLLTSTSLEELYIQANAEHHWPFQDSFFNVQLPKLRVLSCQNIRFSKNTFTELLQMGHLIKLDLHNSIEGDALLAIAQHCPLLRLLCLRFSSVNDQTLAQIAQACTQIINLDLEGTRITDAGIYAVTTHLPGLQSLNIIRCVYLNSTSLVHIYTHCADTLHTLYLNASEEEEPSYDYHTINELFIHCIQLRTLCWEEQVTSFVYSLPPETLKNITTLILYGDAVCGENLLLISQHCTQLHTLSVCNSMAYIPAVTFMCTIDNCSALRHLYCSNNLCSEDGQLDIVQLITHWKDTHPHLTIQEHPSGIPPSLKFNRLHMHI